MESKQRFIADKKDREEKYLLITSKTYDLRYQEC